MQEIKGVYVPFWMFDGEAEGSAQYEAGINFDEVLTLSDERMYENKKLSKQAIL